MHEVSLASFKKYLRGAWEYKFLSGSVGHINDAFKKTFHGIYDLWKEGNTNIFYTDPDTVAMTDIQPWKIADKFMMFNHTDPKSFKAPNRYGRSFDHFFNAGVRFFPASMEQRIWDRALEMVDDWDDDTYDTEQIILNSMLWDQGVHIEDVLRPQWSYQAHWLPHQASVWRQDLWNGCSINQSFIVHVHSSRDIDIKLDLMKRLSQR